MRQSAVIGVHAPYENAVFVGIAHRHAWRIREYTIRKILKNRPREIFLILFIAYRGAMLGLPKIKTTFWWFFLLFSFAFLRFVSRVSKTTTISHIYELVIISFQSFFYHEIDLYQIHHLISLHSYIIYLWQAFYLLISH